MIYSTKILVRACFHPGDEKVEEKGREKEKYSIEDFYIQPEQNKKVFTT